MLRKRDGAVDASLPDRIAAFRRNPKFLERSLMVGLDVLDSFISRFSDNEGSSPDDYDMRRAVEPVTGPLDPPGVEEKKCNERVDKLEAVVEELQQQVLDLTRKVSALQMQLQMQGEVAKLASSVDTRMEELASTCERRVAEAEEALRAEINRIDVTSRISDLESSFGAHTVDLRGLSEDLSRMKEFEKVTRSTVDESRLDLVVADPLDGIIARLTRECGENVHKKGVVVVTASGVHGNSGVHKVVDLRTNSVFCSTNLPGSWLRYDFQRKRVTVVSYTLRSYYYREGGSHPKSWVLEVSNDGTDGTWTIIDQRDDNSDLNDKHVIRNFAVSNRLSVPHRYVRLRSTGKDHSGNDYLQICAFELFGSISH